MAQLDLSGRWNAALVRKGSSPMSIFGRGPQERSRARPIAPAIGAMLKEPQGFYACWACANDSKREAILKRATKWRAKAAKRELIAPRGDKRYIRRDAKGRIEESDDVSRSLSQDRRRKAKTPAKAGQGDHGDRKPAKAKAAKAKTSKKTKATKKTKKARTRK
jgi:hypothetical protein